MDTEDVIQSGTIVAGTETRCTAHVFRDKRGILGDPSLISGTNVRVSHNVKDWPPQILFDAVYASAVLRRFDSEGFTDYSKKWTSTYYPGGLTTALRRQQDVINRGRKDYNDKVATQASARSKRYQNKNKNHDGDEEELDVVSYMPLPIVFPIGLYSKKESREEQEATKAKVHEWRSAIMSF